MATRGRPCVFVTTPNADYSQRHERLAAGTFHHADYRFEWSRVEFAAWTMGVAERLGYTVWLEPMGEETGPPSQLVVFARRSGGL